MPSNPHMGILQVVVPSAVFTDRTERAYRPESWDLLGDSVFTRQFCESSAHVDYRFPLGLLFLQALCSRTALCCQRVIQSHVEGAYRSVTLAGDCLTFRLGRGRSSRDRVAAWMAHTAAAIRITLR